MVGSDKKTKLRGMELTKLAKKVERKLSSGSPIPIKDFEMRIAKDGVWYHQGTPIKRLPLVKLFASVLLKEQDDSYWLVTPVEKGMIEVEDAPFLAVEVECVTSNENESFKTDFSFRTNLDEFVICGPENPLRVNIDPKTQEPNPYILVRDGLEAKITRSVFYELIDVANERIIDGKRFLGIWSKGIFFQLGQIDLD
jgi:hypothetical protein